jgi:hypothetical protein
MPSITLITTGECEHRALGASLQRVFGAAGLEVRSAQRPQLWLTSRYLSYPAPTSAGTLVHKLMHAVMAEIERRDAADFVFAIDDLELPNVDTPHHVTQLVSEAFHRYLHRDTPTHKAIARVRERCSFHLLCPMVEAYFFGEPAPLVRAGARRSAILNPSHHLEDFLADGDMNFVAAGEERGHDWRTPDRFRHRKRYLKFLIDPDDAKLVSYKESRDGVHALETLDWSQVFAYQPPGISFAHALFDDLADALGVENPFPGACHPLTARRSGGTLRNLL